MGNKAKLPRVAKRGNGESAADRPAADYTLTAGEVIAAIRELHARGGNDDVFGRSRGDQDSEID